MRLTIEIDNVRHEIDSTDPELLGKWIVESFGRAIAAGITPATYIRVQAYPSWVPDANQPGGRADWITDSRILGNSYQVWSPRDLLKARSDELDRADAL